MVYVVTGTRKGAETGASPVLPNIFPRRQAVCHQTVNLLVFRWFESIRGSFINRQAQRLVKITVKVVKRIKRGKQWGDTTVGGGGRTEAICWTQIRVSYLSYDSLNPLEMREVETTHLMKSLFVGIA